MKNMLSIYLQNPFLLVVIRLFDMPEMINYLIQKGADVNYSENDPLKLAIASGKPETAITLIENGAKVNIRINVFVSPFKCL